MIRLLFNSLIFFSFILNFNIIIAQKSIVLNTVGNKKIETPQYLKWVYIKKEKLNDSTVIPFVKKRISTELNNLGFLQHKFLTGIIDSLKNDKYFITIEIEEGEQTFIKSIDVKTNSKEDSALVLKYFEPLVDIPFSKIGLENQIENILIYYENNGYPFANIKIESISFENDDENNYARVYLILQKEKLSKINKIEISGNYKTNSSVIVNALRFEKGELYSQQKINNIPNQLNKLRFFNKVETPNYSVNSKGEGILEIFLEEKNTNSFDGIIGYVPAGDNNKKGYLTGFVNISLRNLFGTGRSSAIRWQQETSQTQELELKYLEPWIFDYPFNLTVQFFQRKQDSTYVKRTYGGTLEFLATENISASLILESESIIPSVNKVENITVYNASSLNSGLQLKLDYRDNILAPTKGLYFVSTYRFRSKKINKNQIEGDLDQVFNNYELDFGGYYSLFNNQVIALGLHAKEIIGKDFDISDYFQFGGANTLRGYRENQFLGNRIFWSNAEYRFMLSPQSYIFAFYDLGYFLINENIFSNLPRLSDYKSGYGIGLSIETDLGIMKISYAFSEGSSITNGLIHFGLVNEF